MPQLMKAYIAAIISCSAGLAASLLLNRGRKRIKRERNAVRPAEQFFTVSFYHNVIVLGCEIYAKWKFLEPEVRRHQYQAVVISGFVANFQKYARMRPSTDQAGYDMNYLSGGYVPPGSRQNVVEARRIGLSEWMESMPSDYRMLAYWVMWWSNVGTMFEQDLAKGKTAQALLAGSYGDKLELMLELRFAVGRMLEKEKDLSWSALKPSWIAKLDSIDSSAAPFGTGHSPRHEQLIAENVTSVWKRRS
jgi:hypothetical protein